ncbi:DUF6452 family protein [uncultured Lacinutrix sp.]|uniref:DUF6452 family protein n=1 Tax=uncultured Lacinutrix sp. TaxID=574032 RepID=UPI002616F599|nr:DUF6452 family protein [uncultured Lacinutrix sp.]
MKKKLILLFVFCLTLSCERDDICAESTPTTPRLIMDFLDLSNSDNPKSVANFRVEDADDSTRFLPDYSGSGAATSVILPLKTNENSTQFVLYNGYTTDSDGNVTGGNPDTITIEYGTEEVYVSRACGFKTIFKNVEVTIETDSDNWIQLIQPVNANQSIEDETTTHFNLLH